MQKISTVIRDEKAPEEVGKIWFLVGESVTGRSHIENQLPCQDSFYIENLENGWGLAIVSDGAGSAKQSNIGSSQVAKIIAPRLFKQLIYEKKWHNIDTMPSESEWHKFAKIKLREVRNELSEYAKIQGYDFQTLACTLIVVIFNTTGFMLTHIGDGRAGFCNIQNEWKAMMIPWKGIEPNETVFITSPIWNDKLDNFVESRVVIEEPLAFAVLSDGCEKYSYECSKIDPETGMWTDPNRPYKNFFNPLVKALISMLQNDLSLSEIKCKWKRFLQNGHVRLKNESDDKTMILGVYARNKEI